MSLKDSSFLIYNQDFSLFGIQHLSVIGLMIFLCFTLPFFAKGYLNPKQQLGLSRVLALAASIGAGVYVFILIWLGDFDYQRDLPLDICNLMALLLPFFMWNPSRRIHEVLYFWILAGTIQAIITPHLYNGFPNFIFIHYWMVHAGLVVYAVYVTIVFDYQPTLKSLWKAFGYLQIYIVLIVLVNLILGSNYVYVLRKPPTASALDYFGPWPWYILVCEVLGLIMFFVVLYPSLAFQKKISSGRTSYRG